MAKMSIVSATYGTYTFFRNPSNMPIPKAQKSCAWAETLGGVAYCSWGTFIGGGVYPIKWPFMRSTMFATLDTIYKADESIVFNPEDGSGKTYNGEITYFNGDFHKGGLGVAANTFRINVEMRLLITDYAP